MRAAHVRADWVAFRDAVDAAARASKMSQEAWLKLSARYAALSPEDREVVDGVLAEWVLSEDEGLRSDALFVISENAVGSAVPALRVLAQRLEETDEPGAPYEWAWVNRTIGILTTGEAQ